MNSNNKQQNRHRTFEMIGDCVLLSSVQFSIGSVIMSSSFSIKNFATTQIILQNGADSLMEYIKIALVWSVGVIFVIYSKFGISGAITSLISNSIVVLWIYFSYMSAFKDCVKRNKGLVMPSLHLITPSNHV